MKIFLLIISLYAGSLLAIDFKQPVATFISSGYVIDLLYKNNKVYSATDAGSVDIFDFKTKKKIKTIKVSKIEDFMGDLVDSKVFSVDEFSGDIMILSQSKKGFSRLHVHKNNKNVPLIDFNDQLSILKAKYIDQNTVLLALLSNEIILYNVKKDENIYRVQVSGGKFSDFSLTEDRLKVAVTDESGEIHIYDTLGGKKIKTFKGQNLDNIFQLSYKNGVVATAGQDRRVAIYSTNTDSAYYKKSSFLVYSVGLSPSARLVAFASDEKNNVTVFNTVTKSTVGRFSGNPLTLSNIVFINENEFLVSSNSNFINLYKIR